MEFGCCCNLDQVEAARVAGFDFVETTVVSLEPEADEARFGEILASYAMLALPVKRCNVFLPRDVRIVGPDVNWDRVTRYVNTALTRVKHIGAGLVVFGSGGARQIPDGFERERAEEQLVQFLAIVADAAEREEITIAIEPLNRRESNVINSVAEAARLAQRVNRPAIRILADFYHMEEENEPLAHITDHAAWLAHVHVADSGRLAPGTGQYPYAAFVARLAEAGYGNRPGQLVSVECKWSDFAAEAPQAVAFLRSAWGY